MNRDAEIVAILELWGWAEAQRVPLAGDASARRYERLRAGSRRAVLMDMPPESGLTAAPFLAVTAWLRGQGLSAPEIIAAEPARGLVLLEDLGDDLVARICQVAPEREAALYAAAIDVLAALQAEPPTDADDGWTPPAYDRHFQIRETNLLVEWYLPGATGRAVSRDMACEFEALVAAALLGIPPRAPVAVMRDYHAENLLWLPERRGPARLGLLDYQDMLLGDPAYDLVSLLGDARRTLSPGLSARLTARYLDRTEAEPEAFGHAARVLAVQRNLKILGLFTQLCRRDGKPRYLAHLPRVWSYLETDLAHPALGDLARWMRAHVPAPVAGVVERIARAAA